jgi:hypothetical protein
MDESRKKINEIIDDASGDFSGGGGGGGSAYSTGWATSHGSVTVADGSIHTITHSLGSTDVVVQVYVNSSGSDTNAQSIEYVDQSGYAPGGSMGYAVTSLTSNTITIQLGEFGYADIATTASDGRGSRETLVGKFLKVVVSAGGGGSGVSTFDDDAPTSPSTGDTWWDNGEGKMYIYSGSVWVQTNATGGGSARGGGSYDSGWSTHGGTVADGAALTINHNLGTSDILVQVYLADDASGTNNLMLNNQTDGSGIYLYDYQAQSASSSSIIIQLNGSGYTRAPSSGTTALHYNYTSKFVRVIIHAGGNPIQYNSGWVTSDGTTDVDNGATLIVPHNLGTTDIIVQAYVNTSASDTNAQLVKDLQSAAGSVDYGCTITSLTSNTCTLQLGADGYNDASSTGTLSQGSFASKFIKVVISASVSGAPIAQMAKATISFKGTGTVSITKSHNVYGLTDNGPGDYTVTFTNAIANPIINATCCTISSGIGEISTNNDDSQIGTKSSFIVATNRNGVAADAAYVAVTVF